MVALSLSRALISTHTQCTRDSEVSNKVFKVFGQIKLFQTLIDLSKSNFAKLFFFYHNFVFCFFAASLNHNNFADATQYFAFNTVSCVIRENVESKSTRVLTAYNMTVAVEFTLNYCHFIKCRFNFIANFSVNDKLSCVSTIIASTQATTTKKMNNKNEK